MKSKKLAAKIKKMPFTITGIAVFIIAAVILIHSLAVRNVYEIVLSLAALALWAILFFVGAWTARRLASLEPVWKIPEPLAAASAGDWLVAIAAVKIPWFFRLHFFLRGRFFPQGSSAGCLVLGETSMLCRTDKADCNTARLKISFPLGGSFRGETSSRLKDIFGFFSFPCGNSRERFINIRSAPCGAKALHLNVQSGADDRRNKNSSDEERYYMREYAPGDRFRDINWKSSERIDTLITRISPDNQEKITRIEIYFRNYGPLNYGLISAEKQTVKKRKSKNGPGIADLWLLDRAKARLAWFLRKAKEEKGSYVFNVRTAGEIRELNNEEDIEAFLNDLAAIPFCQAQNEEACLPQSKGELYVFSTSCDSSLPAFLLAQQGRPVSLFLTQNAAHPRIECERLLLRNFFAGAFLPVPQWLLPQAKRRMGVNSSNMMVDSAETRL